MSERERHEVAAQRVQRWLRDVPAKDDRMATWQALTMELAVNVTEDAADDLVNEGLEVPSAEDVVPVFLFVQGARAGRALGYGPSGLVRLLLDVIDSMVADPEDE